MIIDQLPLLAGNALATDEIPLERGTTTYKAELSQLFGSVFDTLEPNFAGAYDETSTYAVGDYVVYEHNLYVCNTAISTAEDWTAAHWTQISVADELLNVATELLALDTNKQETLVSGTNIKTVGGQSLLGSGNIPAGVNRNLLENWYFAGGGSQLGFGVFPINQRGQTSYSTSGYCIDRWKLTSGSVTLSPSGITLNGTIVQILPKSIGLPVVASALLSDGTMITPTYNDSTKTFTLTASNKTIVAVKLEIGDTQTLAHRASTVWVLNEIPNYGEELAKCQQFLVKFGGYQRKRADAVLGSSIDFLFPIPCTMASLPSIIGTLSVHLFGATETEQTGFTFSVPGQGGGYVQIRANKSNHNLTDATCYGTSSWYLSCEP